MRKKIIITVVIIGLVFIYFITQNDFKLLKVVSGDKPIVSRELTQASSTNIEESVIWELREGNIWRPNREPPSCPEPLQLKTPVEVSKVSAILYPGQPRGGAFKPHGAFRFDSKDNNATVTIPLDATLVRGSRAFRNGEDQFSFEFISPCGIWYSLGHLRELTPKYLAIANKLPLIGHFAEQQLFDVIPPVLVKEGEVIATKVGYINTNNAFVDFGVLDLRKKNGKKLRSEWSIYQKEFDQYAVCWLELIPVGDANKLRSLFGSGDIKSGRLSDYCHYPEN